jgi:glycosyltransferase involved in cell wall biosynthesis
VSGLVEQLARFQGTKSALDGDGKPEPPTDAEFQTPYAAPGTEPLLPIGIVYQAGWEPLADGMARHARAQVRALAHSGLPVCLRPLPITRRVMLEDELDPRVIHEVGYLRNITVESVPIAIRQLVFSSAATLENVIAPPGARLAGFLAERQVYASTIVYTSWERTTVHPEMVEVLNRCGQVWVPCKQNSEAFVSSGVDPEKMHVVPCPYDPATSLVCQIPAPRGREDVPAGKRFYAIGKWEPRKNYHALLGAFLLEFSPSEKASLLIKTSEWGTWENYPSVGESIQTWLDDSWVREKGWTAESFAQRVRVTTKKLTEEQITNLHRENNIYVDCSHAEAWALPAFDARCAGNVLVTTSFGGAREYGGEGDMCIENALEPVHPGYGWELNAEWCACPVDQLQGALRAVRPPLRRVHPPGLYDRFGQAAVGAQMKALVLKLADELAPATDDDEGLAYRLRTAGGFG